MAAVGGMGSLAEDIPTLIDPPAVADGVPGAHELSSSSKLTCLDVSDPYMAVSPSRLLPAADAEAAVAATGDGEIGRDVCIGFRSR